MNYPEYVNDWHQCALCGCTRPDRGLTAGVSKDVVLNITSTVYACTDKELCARLKLERAEHLARGLSPGVPIRKRGAR